MTLKNLCLPFIFLLLYLDLPRYESDSDSEIEDRHVYQPVLAEVLYSFKPMNSQELCLEKGALVEVIKRDAGPWWWGQIKHDAILSDGSAECQSGWFPKDFVRVSRKPCNMFEYLNKKKNIFSFRLFRHFQKYDGILAIEKWKQNRIHLKMIKLSENMIRCH